MCCILYDILTKSSFVFVIARERALSTERVEICLFFYAWQPSIIVWKWENFQLFFSVLWSEWEWRINTRNSFSPSSFTHDIYRYIFPLPLKLAILEMTMWARVRTLNVSSPCLLLIDDSNSRFIAQIRSHGVSHFYPSHPFPPPSARLRRLWQLLSYFYRENLLIVCRMGRHHRQRAADTRHMLVYDVVTVHISQYIQKNIHRRHIEHKRTHINLNSQLTTQKSRMTSSDWVPAEQGEVKWSNEGMEEAKKMCYSKWQ